MKNLMRLLNELCRYAEDEGILNPDDRDYARNGLLHLFGEDAWETVPVDGPVDFFAVMDNLLEIALERNLILSDAEPYRDGFEAKVMDFFLPRPAEINRTFDSFLLWDEHAGRATEWFYRLCKATNYIKTARIAKNINYVYEGKYAPLEITINLSKPEKDPKLIALTRQQADEGYPKCALCMENVGYYGTAEKAPRSNHRVVSITLNKETGGWGFQYSPYAYFNEHCIVLKKEHVPMKVDHETFIELIDFVDQFPHYLIGSNAGLPIVGGSILTHYHFQGGNHVFPLENARTLCQWRRKGITIELLDWPMSVVRISGRNVENVVEAVDRVFEAWKAYDNPELGILKEKDGVQHNTVTPILRKGDKDSGPYIFYVVLRNNRATPERPYGLFHPREDYFHIKKENIGLIEVMGLAVLPGRLKAELDLIAECLQTGKDPAAYPDLEKHLPWIRKIADLGLKQENIDDFLRQETGKVFELVLEDCGVFKEESFEAFKSFVAETYGFR
jgi:UDPglucose--hexose-1-phosphate uridylyltransferase